MVKSGSASCSWTIRIDSFGPEIEGGTRLGSGNIEDCCSVVIGRTPADSFSVYEDFGDSLTGGDFCNLLVCRCGCEVTFTACASEVKDSSDSVG